MRAWRISLIGFGLLLLLTGAIVMLSTVKPKGLIGVVLWLVAALILHDGIIGPIVFGFGLFLRKTGRRIPGVVLAILQGAIVLGSIFSIIVLPEMYAKFLGARSDTVLTFDYGLRLAVLWASIAAVAALAIGGYLTLARRQKARPSVSQS